MGTPALYRAFPDVHLVLIEPLAEYEQDLVRLVRETGGEYLLTAVGAHEGTVTIDVDHSNPILSSILKLGEPASAVSAHPGVDALAGDPIAGCDLGYRPPIQDLPHRVIALLDHASLPPHPLGLLPTATDAAGKQTERSCQASPETVKDLVKPTCPASPEPEHRSACLAVTTFLTGSSFKDSPVSSPLAPVAPPPQAALAWTQAALAWTQADYLLYYLALEGTRSK